MSLLLLIKEIEARIEFLKQNTSLNKKKVEVLIHENKLWLVRVQQLVLSEIN